MHIELDLVVEHVPIMCEALSLVFSTETAILSQTTTPYLL